MSDKDFNKIRIEMMLMFAKATTPAQKLTAIASAESAISDIVNTPPEPWYRVICIPPYAACMIKAERDRTVETLLELVSQTYKEVDSE